jgi:16S rRNA (cytosine967-C5)-methyltransferase
MKLYKNLVNAIALTLQEIFTKGRYADKALERSFKQNPQWGSRDRRFIAEGVYDVVRNFRLYSELAQSENNFWFITAVWLVDKYKEVPDWQEFKHVDAKLILQHKELLKSDPAKYQSYPDWLWNLGEQELGKALWEKEAEAMNQLAPVFIRVNSLKTSKQGLSDALKRESIETQEVPEVDSALRLVKRENVFQTKLFKEGWFEVQDAGSQLISDFLAPKPGEFVVDACAGAGGKSLHIAALMKNKGKIISMDLEAWKLDELKKRARRAGVSTIETKVIENDAVIDLFKGKADRLLLDVPCSGLGVIKRNPDTKFKLSPETMERTKRTQREIIENYSAMLKPNGLMVYSTCSLLPSENTAQVNSFLSNNKNFILQKEKTLLPSQGFDGFYMALIKKIS